MLEKTVVFQKKPDSNRIETNVTECDFKNY